MTSTVRPVSGGHPRRRVRRARPTARAVGRLLAALQHREAPYLVLLAGFLVAGSFLRLNGLGAQSLWFDEADVVMGAQASLPDLLRNFVAAGQNGPLYTLFLHLWTAAFGTGEAVVRLPSVLASVATIPLLYAVGRAIHGPKLGLYAAGIVTVAPYQHWYAQEAKMYAIVVLATLASTGLFILALRDDRPGLWLAYVVVTTLALYLHVSAALTMAAQACYFALGSRGRPGGGRRGWIALAALTLPYLPVAVWELRFVLGHSVTWHSPIAPLDFLRVALTKFAVNRADGATEVRALVLFAGLALAGAIPASWRHAPWPAPALTARRRTLLLMVLVVVPMALFYAVTLLRPLFSDRYLIIVTPAFYLLVAGGVLLIEHSARPLAPLALAALLATVWVPLRDVNLSGASQKEDWRAAYAHIAAHAHPNDVVIVHPGYLATTLRYYQLRSSRLQQLPLVTVPAEYTETAGAPDDSGLDLYLQEVTGGFERVWLVLSADRLAQIDREDWVRGWWLRYNARLIDERELNGVWLGLYSYSRPFRSPYYPPVPIRLDVSFGAGEPTLLGYGYDFPPGQSDVRPGEHVPLVLRWIFPTGQSSRLKIRWHLRDADGARVPGVGKTEVLLGGRPLEHPGEVWDYHDLRLPASLGPGRYQLFIEGLPADGPGQPLPATSGQQPLPAGVVPLGWIEVRR